MSEDISDFAGAGANVVAKGVSIAQYRDDKSRRRIEAYDTFEENAKNIINEIKMDMIMENEFTFKITNTIQ